MSSSAAIWSATTAHSTPRAEEYGHDCSTIEASSRLIGTRDGLRVRGNNQAHPLRTGIGIGMPRQYQSELAEKVLDRNTVVVLPTNSGKTLIASLAIHEFLTNPHYYDQIVIFLAPTVILCEQQHKRVVQDLNERTSHGYRRPILVKKPADNLKFDERHMNQGDGSAPLYDLVDDGDHYSQEYTSRVFAGENPMRDQELGVDWNDVETWKTMFQELYTAKKNAFDNATLENIFLNQRVKEEYNSLKNKLTEGESSDLVDEMQIDFEEDYIIPAWPRLFFMTPDKMIRFLRHAHFQMSNIALIVFDECHHFTPDHAYAVVMEQYWKRAALLQQNAQVVPATPNCNGDSHEFRGNIEPENSAKFSRPLILGLTASPIARKIELRTFATGGTSDHKMAKFIGELERVYCAVVDTASDKQIKSWKDQVDMYGGHLPEFKRVSYGTYSAAIDWKLFLESAIWRPFFELMCVDWQVPTEFDEETKTCMEKLVERDELVRRARADFRARNFEMKTRDMVLKEIGTDPIYYMLKDKEGFDQDSLEKNLQLLRLCRIAFQVHVCSHVMRRIAMEKARKLPASKESSIDVLLVEHDREAAHRRDMDEAKSFAETIEVNFNEERQQKSQEIDRIIESLRKSIEIETTRALRLGCERGVSQTTEVAFAGHLIQGGSKRLWENFKASMDTSIEELGFWSFHETMINWHLVNHEWQVAIERQQGESSMSAEPAAATMLESMNEGDSDPNGDGLRWDLRDHKAQMIKMLERWFYGMEGFGQDAEDCLLKSSVFWREPDATSGREKGSILTQAAAEQQRLESVSNLMIDCLLTMGQKTKFCQRDQLERLVTDRMNRMAIPCCQKPDDVFNANRMNNSHKSLKPNAENSILLEICFGILYGSESAPSSDGLSVQVYERVVTRLGTRVRQEVRRRFKKYLGAVSLDKNSTMTDRYTMANTAMALLTESINGLTKKIARVFQRVQQILFTRLYEGVLMRSPPIVSKLLDLHRLSLLYNRLPRKRPLIPEPGPAESFLVSDKLQVTERYMRKLFFAVARGQSLRYYQGEGGKDADGDDDLKDERLATDPSLEQGNVGRTISAQAAATQDDDDTAGPPSDPDAVSSDETPTADDDVQWDDAHGRNERSRGIQLSSEDESMHQRRESGQGSDVVGYRRQRSSSDDSRRRRRGRENVGDISDRSDDRSRNGRYRHEDDYFEPSDEPRFRNHWRMEHNESLSSMSDGEREAENGTGYLKGTDRGYFQKTDRGPPVRARDYEEGRRPPSVSYGKKRQPSVVNESSRYNSSRDRQTDEHNPSRRRRFAEDRGFAREMEDSVDSLIRKDSLVSQVLSDLTDHDSISSDYEPRGSTSVKRSPSVIPGSWIDKPLQFRRRKFDFKGIKEILPPKETEFQTVVQNFSHLVKLKALIFCDMRLKANLLSNYLNFRRVGRSGWITGASETPTAETLPIGTTLSASTLRKQSPGGLDMSLGRINVSQQKKTVEHFRRQDLLEGRALQILVSTSIIEEGFDVPDCNAVLRFDPPHTLAQQIQSRGRARAKNSSYIVLQPSGGILPAAQQQNFISLEEIMLRVVSDTERRKERIIAVEQSKMKCSVETIEELLMDHPIFDKNSKVFIPMTHARRVLMELLFDLAMETDAYGLARQSALRNWMNCRSGKAGQMAELTYIKRGTGDNSSDSLWMELPKLKRFDGRDVVLSGLKCPVSAGSAVEIRSGLSLLMLLRLKAAEVITQHFLPYSNLSTMFDSGHIAWLKAKLRRGRVGAEYRDGMVATTSVDTLFREMPCILRRWKIIPMKVLIKLDKTRFVAKLMSKYFESPLSTKVDMWHALDDMRKSLEFTPSTSGMHAEDALRTVIIKKNVAGHGTRDEVKKRIDAEQKLADEAEAGKEGQVLKEGGVTVYPHRLYVRVTDWNSDILDSGGLFGFWRPFFNPPRGAEANFRKGCKLDSHCLHSEKASAKVVPPRHLVNFAEKGLSRNQGGVRLDFIDNSESSHSEDESEASLSEETEQKVIELDGVTKIIGTSTTGKKQRLSSAVHNFCRKSHRTSDAKRLGRAALSVMRTKGEMDGRDSEQSMCCRYPALRLSDGDPFLVLQPLAILLSAPLTEPVSAWGRHWGSKEAIKVIIRPVVLKDVLDSCCSVDQTTAYCDSHIAEIYWGWRNGKNDLAGIRTHLSAPIKFVLNRAWLSVLQGFQVDLLKALDIPNFNPGGAGFNETHMRNSNAIASLLTRPEFAVAPFAADGFSLDLIHAANSVLLNPYLRSGNKLSDSLLKTGPTLLETAIADEELLHWIDPCRFMDCRHLSVSSSSGAKRKCFSLSSFACRKLNGKTSPLVDFKETIFADLQDVCSSMFEHNLETYILREDESETALTIFYQVPPDQDAWDRLGWIQRMAQRYQSPQHFEGRIDPSELNNDKIAASILTLHLLRRGAEPPVIRLTHQLKRAFHFMRLKGIDWSHGPTEYRYDRSLVEEYEIVHKRTCIPMESGNTFVVIGEKLRQGARSFFRDETYERTLAVHSGQFALMLPVSDAFFQIVGFLPAIMWALECKAKQLEAKMILERQLSASLCGFAHKDNLITESTLRRSWNCDRKSLLAAQSAMPLPRCSHSDGIIVDSFLLGCCLTLSAVIGELKAGSSESQSLDWHLESTALATELGLDSAKTVVFGEVVSLAEECEKEVDLIDQENPFFYCPQWKWERIAQAIGEAAYVSGADDTLQILSNHVDSTTIISPDSQAMRSRSAVPPSLGSVSPTDFFKFVCPPVSRVLHNQVLEFLGDAVLKYIAGVWVFFNWKDANEEGLSRKADILKKNQTLRTAVRNSHLHSFIVANGFVTRSKGRFGNVTLADLREQNVSEKNQADVLESLLAVIYWSNYHRIDLWMGASDLILLKYFLKSNQTLRMFDLHDFKAFTLPLFYSTDFVGSSAATLAVSTYLDAYVIPQVFDHKLNPNLMSATSIFRSLSKNSPNKEGVHDLLPMEAFSQAEEYTRPIFQRSIPFWEHTASRDNPSETRSKLESEWATVQNPEVMDLTKLAKLNAEVLKVPSSNLWDKVKPIQGPLWLPNSQDLTGNYFCTNKCSNDQFMACWLGGKNRKFRSECIGYVWEARTHPSANGLIYGMEDYQRLEFLGDACLGMLLTEWLQKVFPDAREGALTVFKGTMQSNRYLSRVFCRKLLCTGHDKGDNNKAATELSTTTARFIRPSTILLHQGLDEKLRHLDKLQRMVAKSHPEDDFINALKEQRDKELSNRQDRVGAPVVEKVETTANQGQTVTTSSEDFNQFKFLADVYEAMVGVTLFEFNFDIRMVWEIIRNDFEPSVPKMHRSMDCDDFLRDASAQLVRENA